MKIVWILLCIACAGCGAKTQTDMAKDLVKEKLKTSLPDFKNYEGLNFGALGKAFLPYEESAQNIANVKALKDCKDSIAILQKMATENKAPSTAGDSYKKRIQQLQDSVTAKNERNHAAKQSYTPEQLFKISHAYLLKDSLGEDKKTEDEFYFDKDLKRVVKIHKVY